MVCADTDIGSIAKTQVLKLFVFINLFIVLFLVVFLVENLCEYLSLPRYVTAIKLSIVGAGHARDDGATILQSRRLNVAGAARSYGVLNPFRSRQLDLPGF
jgi:hypothetical protein